MVTSLLKKDSLTYIPIQGRTYSLFGISGSTNDYYSAVKDLANRVLEIEPSVEFWLDTLVRNSSRKALLRKLQSKPLSNLPFSICLNLTSNALHRYTQATESYLKQLYIKKIWDRDL